jgi:hypothetical protein
MFHDEIKQVCSSFICVTLKSTCAVELMQHVDLNYLVVRTQWLIYVPPTVTVMLNFAQIVFVCFVQCQE